MRSTVAILAAVVAAGCVASSDAAGPGDDDPPPLAGIQCAIDADCVLAGPTCCDCPEIALPRSSGWAEACEDVSCPNAPACSSTVALCNADKQCVLACATTTCEMSCPAGFFVDGNGCLGCTCAAPGSVEPECDDATDCARVRADCCGCALGGEDTAVPAGDAGTYEDMLGCPPTPSCPGVDVCDPDTVVACRSGECVLESGMPTDLPPNACGRDDLPACPTGEQCTINSDPEANQAGVGVCAPA